MSFDTSWMDKEERVMYRCLRAHGEVSDDLEGLLSRRQEIVEQIKKRVAEKKQETAGSPPKNWIAQSLEYLQETERENEDGQSPEADLEEIERQIRRLIGEEFATATK